MTATLLLLNWGQPATEVRLYSSRTSVAALSAQAPASEPWRGPRPDTPGPVAAELLD